MMFLAFLLVLLSQAYYSDCSTYVLGGRMNTKVVEAFVKVGEVVSWGDPVVELMDAQWLMSEWVYGDSQKVYLRPAGFEETSRFKVKSLNACPGSACDGEIPLATFELINANL